MAKAPMQHGVQPGLQISQSPLRHSVSSSAASTICTRVLSFEGRAVATALGYLTAAVRCGLRRGVVRKLDCRSDGIVGECVHEAVAQCLSGVQLLGCEEHLQ